MLRVLGGIRNRGHELFLGGRVRSYQGKELMFSALPVPIKSPEPSQNHGTVIITLELMRQGDDCLTVIFWLSKINSEINDIKKFCMHDSAGEKNTHPASDVSIGSAHHLCLSGGLRPLWGLPLSLTYLIRPLKLINMNASRGQLKAFLRKEGRREREEEDGEGGQRKGVLCLWTMS